MNSRLGTAVLTTGLAMAGLAGLAVSSSAVAGAAPACADFHWIGAAGSGQRDGAALAANGGMGDVVYQSYQQLAPTWRRADGPSPPKPFATRQRPSP